MTFAQVVAIAGIACLSLFPSSNAEHAREPGSAGGLTIGVIDVAKAFEQNPRYISMKQELEAMKKSCDERLAEFGRGIKELGAAIDMLEPESEPRRRKQLLYDLKIREAEGTERLMKENLDREVMVRELTIYEEIEEAARKVAEAKGASIVIRLSRRETGDAKTMNAASLRQRHAAARGRDVLYAADQLDLTDDVIKRLLVPPEKPGAGK